MERNFFRRIEVAFPIEDKAHRDRVINELEMYLADTEQAWILRADGTYSRPSQQSGGLSAQRSLLRRYAEGFD
jgi:polyphosphate kinase